MRVRAAAVSTLALVSILVGCSDADDRRDVAVAVPSPLSPAPSTAEVTATPSPTGSEPAPTSTATASAAARAVYYLHDSGRGPRLYREFHRRPATSSVIRDAVTAMLTEKAVDEDYTSLWPAGTAVRGVSVSGTTATVDLSSAAQRSSAGAEAEAASLQQLVYTVTAAAPAVKAVQLLIEGRVVQTLWGHADTRRPMARRMAAEVLGPVWILEPADGRLPRGGTFRGEASVFEATVSWEIRKGAVVVRKGFSTASTGAPGRGTWTARADVPPGSYVLRAFESSAEDGRETFVDDKPLTVT